MVAYYNEIDPYAAGWLKNLIRAGHIADGVVDERSIVDVDSADLADFVQCHFFAGIGAWSYALRLAGWPDDRPVWTGSCPCQPFSAAGKGAGFNDKRHLWPDFFRLIAARQPSVVFGEQVASKDGLQWLDLVHADLEGSGYAVGAADLCAAGVGAPHVRPRLWWVADADMPHATRQRPVSVSVEPQQKTSGRRNGDYWSCDDVVRCADNKSRPIKSSVQPLAHGSTARVGRLRAYGNAIVPQVAAEFIGAYLEA